MSDATIPADPSLVLGHLVDPERIAMLQKIAEVQNPQALEESTYNSLVLAIHSLKETAREMASLGVDDSSIQIELDKLREQLAESAIRLAQVSIETELATMELLENADQTLINSSSTSPLDLKASQLKKLPLSSDSLEMDVQYFRNELNVQGQSAHASTISSYVAEKRTGAFEHNYSHNHADIVRNQVQQQVSNHVIEGTLVLTAYCTHRNVQILDPFVLNARLAVDVWNEEFPQNKLKTDATTIYAAAGVGGKGATKSSKETSKDGNDSNIECMHILDGASYGSSFVGMVHILQVERSESSQTSSSTSERDQTEGKKIDDKKKLTDELKQQMAIELALSEQTGSYGVSKEFAKSAKRLFSTSQLSVHCTLITEGIIPTIQSNTMKTTVQNLKPSPQDVMEQLAAIKGASGSVVDSSMEALAGKATMGQQFMSLNSEYLKNAVSALGAYDTDNNQVLDVGTFFTAFSDFLTKAMAGDAGTPMQFSIRKLRKEDIARAYIKKYYPDGARNQEDAMRGALGQMK